MQRTLNKFFSLIPSFTHFSVHSSSIPGGLGFEGIIVITSLFSRYKWMWSPRHAIMTLHHSMNYQECTGTNSIESGHLPWYNLASSLLSPRALSFKNLSGQVGRAEDTWLGTSSNIKRAVTGLEQHLEYPKVTLLSSKGHRVSLPSTSLSVPLAFSL